MKQRIELDDLEDKVEKNTQAEQQKEKRILKDDGSLRNIMDNMKHNNIQIMGIPEGEKSEQGLENLFEGIMTENFHNLVMEKDTQVQEAQRVPQKLDPKMPTLIMMRHIIIEMARLKDKKRILKVIKEKQTVIYKGEPIRLI